MKKLLCVILPILMAAVIGCTASNSGVKESSSAAEAAASEDANSSQTSASSYISSSTCASSSNTPKSSEDSQDSIVYKNDKYGFTFTLPQSFKGYTIVDSNWKANDETVKISGPELLIRHPDWTSDNPRQDIPIMIFTTDQWKALENDELHIGAAPINPSELDRNSKYVFALPARYNYSFLTGFEEVDKILSDHPLKAFEI